MSEPDFTSRSDGTLSGLLRSLASDCGNAEALVYPAFAHGGQQLRRTFGDLDSYVDDLARGLIGLGIEHGDHVAIWAGNVPDWVPLEFALARIGAVLVTVNTALQAGEVAFVLSQSKAVAVLHTTRTGSNEASAILDELLATDEHARIRVRLWMPAHGSEPTPEGLVPGRGNGPLVTIADVVAAGRGVADAARQAREDACTPDETVNIQYTSGTTGFPKGVMLNHTNLLSSAKALGNQVGLGPNDRVALIVPLFHCFGCVVAVLGSYSYGAALCCLQGFEPGDALQLIDAERCTVVHGVPTMFSAMLAHPDLPQRDTTSLRTGLAAGAPVPEPLMMAIIETLHCEQMCIAYGLTEAAPGVTGTYPEDRLEVRCATIGRPLPGVEVRVVDPRTGHDVATGEEGELLARGPNVMVGYHDEPRATADALSSDGWLHTGDLARARDDGNYCIVGRSKDIIIRGGENIAPAEIESMLREHPDIVDVAVIGIPDDHFGEEVAAAVILQDGAELDDASYAALLDGRIASFKFPKVWRRFEHFPLTGSGKVQKFRLRELFAGS